MKIELPANGGRIDVACYPGPYTRGLHGKCAVIMENKDFSWGLHYAPGEARRYAKGFPTARVLVVSNGYCYKTYVRQGGDDF